MVYMHRCNHSVHVHMVGYAAYALYQNNLNICYIVWNGEFLAAPPDRSNS